MNWQSHEEVVFKGLRYGQKDIEFQKFLALPELVDTRLELGVAGKATPRDELCRQGWRLRDPHLITMSYESFCNYVVASLAEFAVCKNAFVALNTGWFSDRSAVYLASGRPVVMQETGFSQHLPTGEGLFAVRTAEEAADALCTIAADYPRHSRRAREIACEHLDSRRVLSAFLSEVGV
jgi:hypothetical protein